MGLTHRCLASQMFFRMGKNFSLTTLTVSLAKFQERWEDQRKREERSLCIQMAYCGAVHDVGPMCWAALDQFCEGLALNEQHKLSRFRAISRSKCHTWHRWCPSAHLLSTLNPTHIWAWTTHSQMIHSMLIHPQMSHERVGKRRHFHLDRQETQQCATAMSQCSLLGLGEVAKELFCFLPIDATQQHELRWQVFISCNISFWQLLPPLTFWGPLVCDPGSLFHSPMLQAFGRIVWQTKILISGRWLTQIEHFRFLVFWNYGLDAGKSILSSFLHIPHDLPGPCCGLCRLSLCTLRLQAFGPQASEVPAWPAKKSYGKISHEIWQKIGSAKQKKQEDGANFYLRKKRCLFTILS